MILPEALVRMTAVNHCKYSKLLKTKQKPLAVQFAYVTVLMSMHNLVQHTMLPYIVVTMVINMSLLF